MPNPNTQSKGSNDIVAQVAERVRSSDNVLVALSKDPSVDDLTAALGLTFILDKMGKHATAIFSGAVPNAIEFLEPEKTFETNTNSLQDFIIALDKEKADHLRYKIDGDYVKVFITPYKTTIDEKDMEFSHGDYNVDLVIALNVASSDDLDSALSEYGRIMHDASSINISANVPGKFGDLEWGNPAASSVSEMVYQLSEAIKEKDKENVDKPTATALLAGIVSATNRFSNERTSPDTMAVASKLMAAGADQQLISSSIPVDILTSDVVDASDDAKAGSEDDLSDVIDHSEQAKKEEKPADPTALEIHHASDKADEDEEKAPEPKEEKKDSESASAPAPEKKTEEKKTEEPAPKPQSKPQPEPEPEPEPAPAPEPQPEPEPEPEPVITPIAPAVPEPQIELSADDFGASPSEQADATAKLEQLVAPTASAGAEKSVLNELQDPNAHTKKNLVPPSEALEPPKVPKDYAAMMASELSDNPAPAPANASESEPLIAPIPSGLPIMDTSPEPSQESAPEEETVNNEFVDPPLPMPDANTILPPPPLPFDPAEAPSSAEDAPASAPLDPASAQVFAGQVQSEAVNPGPPNIVTNPLASDITMPPVAESALADSQPSASPNIHNGVMQDQVYPADPSAFQIPGM